MGQQQRHRYEQQGLPGTGVSVERYGPERPGPTLDTAVQGRLPVDTLGPLFGGTAPAIEQGDSGDRGDGHGTRRQWADGTEPS